MVPKTLFELRWLLAAGQSYPEVFGVAVRELCSGFQVSAQICSEDTLLKAPAATASAQLQPQPIGK